jgi:hypothetical protein
VELPGGSEGHRSQFDARSCCQLLQIPSKDSSPVDLTMPTLDQNTGLPAANTLSVSGSMWSNEVEWEVGDSSCISDHLEIDAPSVLGVIARRSA